MAYPSNPRQAPIPRALMVVATVCTLVTSTLADAPYNLANLSLEELMDVEVSLVSRRPQRIGEAAAAVSVVRGDELRRAGVRTLPDALRLVPGFQVGQVDANKWVVTSRGFAGLFSNKLLVLVDGRSVYTPLFAGVFWESVHVPLEEVDRIEVIRGPGGTQWGANAVNGIVNVVTRDAADSQGSFVQAGGGNERRFVAARHGSRLGNNGHVRVHAEHFERQRTAAAGSRSVRDDWDMSNAGVRADFDMAGGSRLTLQGDIYSGEVGQSLTYQAQFPPPFAETRYFDANISGGDLLARWETGDDDRSTQVQAYYDHFYRDEDVVAGRIHKFDVDTQHRRRLGRHELVGGAGYRLTHDRFDGTFTISLVPAKRTTHRFSAFVHDELSWRQDRLRTSFGAKVERNSYTGVEWQPDARVWWSPRQDHAVWLAASRAVRTPSRGDNDIRGVLQALPADSLFSGAPITLVTAYGDRDFRSEKLTAFDAGYRAVLGGGWTMDIAGFRNRYNDLLTQEPGLTIAGDEPEPHLVLPVRNANLAQATTHGIEISLERQLREWWQLRGTYGYLSIDLELAPGSRDFISSTFPGESPQHQFGLRSLTQWGPWSVYAGGRWIDQIETPGIDAYATIDARVARQIGDGWEVAVTGRSLAQDTHREAVSEIVGAVHTAVEREVYVSVAWRRL